jgi:hypothetical protein
MVHGESLWVLTDFTDEHRLFVLFVRKQFFYFFAEFVTAGFNRDI